MRCRGPVKSVALCFMKRGEKKDIKSQHFPPDKGISRHEHTHIHTCTLPLTESPPVSYYKAEWRGGMASFVVFVSVCVSV